HHKTVRCCYTDCLFMDDLRDGRIPFLACMGHWLYCTLYLFSAASEPKMIHQHAITPLPPDLDHSEENNGISCWGCRIVIAAGRFLYQRPPRTRIISARLATRMNESNMKKSKKKARPAGSNEDAMRPEYDSSK